MYILMNFGKVIQEKLIYKKVKIKSRDNKYVVCTSFHFPEREMNFPYINF